MGVRGGEGKEIGGVRVSGVGVQTKSDVFRSTKNVQILRNVINGNWKGKILHYFKNFLILVYKNPFRAEGLKKVEQ